MLKQLNITIEKKVIGFYCSLLLIVAFTWSNIAQAGFTSVTVIGDSFSDGGNHETAKVSFYKLFGDPFPQKISNNRNKPYYFDYKFSNSYVAVEHLAYHLGLFDKSHFNNYAVGGFSSNEIPEAIAYLKQHHTFDPSGLYVIAIGQNDILRHLDSNEIITTRILDLTKSLYTMGARHFMIVNAVMLGDIPPNKWLTPSEKEMASSHSLLFNQLLTEKMDTLAFKAHVTIYDLGGIVREGTKHAIDFGITNTVDSCLALECNNPNTFLWLDDVHFTGVAHEAIGYSMYSVIAPKAPTISSPNDSDDD